MSRTELRSVAFRREREPSWRRLERLLDRIDKAGVRALDEKQLAQLPVLHRAAMSALSVARSVSLDRNLLEYLETLTTRSYIRIYGNRSGLRSTFRDFFRQRFPAAVRSGRWALLMACLFMALGIATGFALTLSDMERYYSFVAPEMAQGRDPTATDEELREVLFSEFEAGSMLTHFATFLFTHNTQVGILCFALGFALGIPVVYLLFFNGMLLGAMGALYHDRGMSVEFWSWVSPHGVTELGAICLCGAAGLMQGHAVLFPGRKTRLAHLADRGRTAGAIVIGCVAMFALAALIEGFFRQLVHSVPVRYTVTVTTAVLWTAYFVFAGRRAR